MENVLVESGEEKDLVGLQRTANGAPDLLLAVVRLESEEWGGGAERTVAKVVKACAMVVVRSGLGDHVDHSAARASLLSAIGIRGNAKLLHDFRGELIRGTVASPRLRKEGIVIVSAVD